MIKEYIERGALLKALRENSRSWAHYIEAIFVAEKVPVAADVVEVKHGRWIWQSANMIECSCCGDALLDKAYNWWPAETPYCPNCGAKMDGE